MKMVLSIGLNFSLSKIESTETIPEQNNFLRQEMTRLKLESDTGGDFPLNCSGIRELFGDS